MSIKFTDLQFVNHGCCDTHLWAEVRHNNGLLTRVYQEDVGYSVSTHCGQTLIKAQTQLADGAAVEQRLAEDAA